MIKRMEGDNFSISRLGEDQISLTVDGNDMVVTIDEFEKINRVMSMFWDVNNLYRETSEAKKNRERDEVQREVGVIGKSKTLASSRY